MSGAKEGREAAGDEEDEETMYVEAAANSMEYLDELQNLAFDLFTLLVVGLRTYIDNCRSRGQPDCACPTTFFFLLLVVVILFGMVCCPQHRTQLRLI